MAEQTRTGSRLEVVVMSPDQNYADPIFDSDEALEEAEANELHHIRWEASPLENVARVVMAVYDFVDAVRRAHLVRAASPDLVSGDVEIELMRQPKSSARDLTVVRISMESPLTLELLVTGAGVASTAVYLFRNPDKIGEWIPKLQAGWYRGRVEAERAKRAYIRLRGSRTTMRELE
ncbi:hypothetical protein [Acrocarpospora sp. B8E8]|uniref:hypothetical protein n=1 Tax=Acrocarpospora sp. B8E8 TaxID=3153572 RepID=UPI00325E7179